MGLTYKQKEVYDFIVSYSAQNGFAPTQQEIKEQFGLKSFGSVQKYLQYLIEAELIEMNWNGRRGITLKNNPEFQTSSSTSSSYHENHSLEVPILGNVAAGNPIEAIEQSDQTISVPTQLIKNGHRHFALKVRGDSMREGGILPDDYVICRAQNEAKNGQTVVAMINGEATVKIYQKLKNKIELIPQNQHYPIIEVDPISDQFTMAGIVIGLIRKYE